jgi:hypothetical protein
MLAGLVAQEQAPRAVPRFNPRPPGEICPGSTTEAVHDFLRRRRDIAPNSWIPRSLVVHATGRTGKAVDWALTFLRAKGLVESSEDPRNARYLRYRLAQPTQT